MKSLLLAVLALGATATAAGDSVPSPQKPPTPSDREPFVLKSTKIPGIDEAVLQGVYEVFEDRDAGSGRRIGLKVVVLPATKPDPEPDAIFILAGGPGVGATAHAAGYASSWMREDRDIVLVDQRGTGESNPLRCRLGGEGDSPQRYLDPIFQEPAFRECLEELKQKADLTLYTTPIAMDDLNEVRAALGYGTINLNGGSYGTRAALVYMRRHPELVRTAVLTGVAPISFKNPLYHAREAQTAIEGTFEACESDAKCRAAFPELNEEFEAVLERLEREPASVTSEHGVNEIPTKVRLSREAFAEALRVMMYYPWSARSVPLKIHNAYQGDYGPFVQLGIGSNRNIRDQLAFGMLLSVICAEDVARIDPDEIERETRGTFLGDGRVRRQSRVCEFWPKGRVPENYGEPVTSSAPTLLLSGTLDPVTSPRFAREAARHLENSLHVTLAGPHSLRGPCVDSLVRQILERGSVDGIDTSCAGEVTLPDFELPASD